MENTSENSPQKIMTINPENTISTTINDLLTPILKTIRNNKINNFYQLKKKPAKEDNNPSIFSAKDDIMSPVRELGQMSKTFYGGMKKDSPVFDFAPETSEKSRRGSEIKPYEAYRKNVYITPKTTSFKDRSKIKKHLIQSIDYKEIQNRLYKKRQYITRYEYFYDQLKEKNEKKDSKQKSQRNYHTSHERKTSENKSRKQISPQMIKNFATINFKTTAKKKFWIRQKNNKTELKNYLKGKSLKNAL